MRGNNGELANINVIKKYQARGVFRGVCDGVGGEEEEDEKEDEVEEEKQSSKLIGTISSIP